MVLSDVIVAEPWWHTALEVMGGVLTGLTIVGIIGAWAVRTRRIHVLQPRLRAEKEQDDRWAAQLGQIKDLLGVNGVPITTQLSNQIDTLTRRMDEHHRRLEHRLDEQAASEQMHRATGYSIAKMQAAAAQQAGIHGWPDPEHFPGMLGLPQDRADDE